MPLTAEALEELEQLIKDEEVAYAAYTVGQRSGDSQS
jgi:hypothetical protein